MTPAERYWLRLQRRAGTLTPDLAAAVLRAWRTLGEHFSTREIERLIASGDIEGVVRTALSERNLTAAFQPVRQRLQQQTADSVRTFARDLPAAAQTVGITFDVLNPRVIDAVRRLDTTVMRRLSDDVRATVRQHLERGLREGVGPRTMARGLRGVVGLAPNQEAAIENFRKLLREGRFSEILQHRALTGKHAGEMVGGRALADRRYDRLLRRLQAEGKGLSEEQITRMADAYRRRMVAFNAETQARTASLDSLKLGQRLAWEDAAEKGVIDRGSLTKTWKGVMDNRERDSHVAMEGVTVPFDAPYMVEGEAEMYPGEGEYNCRCIDLVRAA